MYNIEDMLLGIAVGDALGVPYEFEKRGRFVCTDMIGFGSHDQPAGTWSDDTSLTLCLADAMDKNTINYEKIAKNMVNWMKNKKFLAGKYLFDIGNTTRYAIMNMANGIEPTECGPNNISSNGNGALMRIAPLVYYLMQEDNIDKRFEVIKNVTSMTHGHVINIIGCQIFIEYLLQLYNTKDKFIAYQNMKYNINEFYKTHDDDYVDRYAKVLVNDISKCNHYDIDGKGYVISTLEAALYCFLVTDNYKDAVLMAVNLGDDTDTTAAVVGALAGPYYGKESIPCDWLEMLQNKELIYSISEKFFFK